jgi:hypothetical protein
MGIHQTIQNIKPTISKPRQSSSLQQVCPAFSQLRQGRSHKQEMQSVMNGFSDLQFQQILSIMNNKGINQTFNPQANAVVTSSGLLQAPLRLH